MMAFFVDSFLVVMPVNLVLGAVYGFEAFHHPELHPELTWIQLGIVGAVMVVFWHLRGQTPGKKALRIKVVGRDGMPLGWGRAVLRFVGYGISAVSIIGFLLPLFLKRHQALHDLLAGSVVVYDT